MVRGRRARMKRHGRALHREFYCLLECNVRLTGLSSRIWRLTLGKCSCVSVLLAELTAILLRLYFLSANTTRGSGRESHSPPAWRRCFRTRAAAEECLRVRSRSPGSRNANLDEASGIYTNSGMMEVVCRYSA